MILNNSLTPAGMEETRARAYQPDILAGHEDLDIYRRKSHLEPESWQAARIGSESFGKPRDCLRRGAPLEVGWFSTVKRVDESLIDP